MRSVKNIDFDLFIDFYGSLFIYYPQILNNAGNISITWVIMAVVSNSPRYRITIPKEVRKEFNLKV